MYTYLSGCFSCNKSFYQATCSTRSPINTFPIPVLPHSTSHLHSNQPRHIPTLYLTTPRNPPYPTSSIFPTHQTHQTHHRTSHAPSPSTTPYHPLHFQTQIHTPPTPPTTSLAPHANPSQPREHHIATANKTAQPDGSGTPVFEPAVG